MIAFMDVLFGDKPSRIGRIIKGEGRATAFSFCVSLFRQKADVSQRCIPKQPQRRTIGCITLALLVFVGLLLTCPALQAEEINYQYDTAGQLIQTQYQGIATEDFIYDAMGNRFSHTISDSASPANSAPNSPANPEPADAAEGVPPGVALGWSGSDPDAGDALAYRVYFGKIQPPPLLRIERETTAVVNYVLDSYTTYYWQVVAVDPRNGTTPGPVWHFTTGNTPPNTPVPLLPADQARVAYLNIDLRWVCTGDQNPNDTVVFDLYLSPSPEPEIFEENIIEQRFGFNGLTRGLDTTAVYYWRVAARDNHGVRTPGEVRRFTFLDSDFDGLPDDLEATMCTSASNPDTDGDRLRDGIEDANHNGVIDGGETHPCNDDTDGDRMPDGWEVGYGTNPFDNDAQVDDDMDGFDNFTEYVEGSDPGDTAFMPGDPRIEGFETGDFSKYFWITDSQTGWRVTTVEPFAGLYAARSGAVAAGETSALETTVYCEAGHIRFFYKVSARETEDRLIFYIDDEAQAEWSGEQPYARADFPVTAGRHTFRWAYIKDTPGAAGQDAVRIDDIVFPGPPDTDGDGVLDGWEFIHFGSLDHDLCGDSNGDGVSDLAAALVLADPVGGDSDGDGMPDIWEADHGLLLDNDDDAWLDADLDGFLNYQEYIGHTDPQNSDDTPSHVREDFESGDLTQVYWVLEGDGLWQVTGDNPHQGVFSARAPTLDDAQSAVLQTTLDSNQGFIAFYVAVSSEADGDFIRFYIDDDLQDQWSGDEDYQFVIFPVSAGVHTFKWEYAKNSADAGLADTAWIDDITFPGSGDRDGDGVLDGWELTFFGTLNHELCGDSNSDGVSDLAAALVLADPIGNDTDGDGMSDIYEAAHDLSLHEDDAWDDPDGDGYANYDEFIGNTDPRDQDDTPRNAREDFETADFTRFYWILGGDAHWQVSTDAPYEGTYAARSPAIGDGQTAFMETTLTTISGPVTFYFMTSTEAGGDWLRFYVDDEIAGQWSGELAYQRVRFVVPAGLHTFRWEYAKNGTAAALDDVVRIDHISFPGSSDSDGDGVLDGWEITYFGTLDQDLCNDSDGDGISDLAAAVVLADPIGSDTDGDGLPDTYEASHDLDRIEEDAWSDPDGDGYSNYDEFIGHSDPQDKDDTPRHVLEDFETGDLTKFYWVRGGDGLWSVSGDNPFQGNYSAQSPVLIDGQSAFMATTINCRQGFIGFHYSVGSQAESDGLRFYIDDVLQGQWTGDLAFQFTVYPVTAGEHTFRWEYAKDGAGSEFEDAAWVDNISFPGSGDSDADGVLDGWEYFFFGALNMDLCQDSDGDGNTDLQAAVTLATPYAYEDADRDGLSDTTEEIGCTDGNNADSDDDGLVDGAEDSNKNGVWDEGETDPCNRDSDGDGIQDGTESGLTLADIGPDTDRAFFIPDADPSSTTDPTAMDSDHDWLADGEEDIDHNGRADDGETSADLGDSDIDGYPDGYEVMAGADPLHQDWYLPIVFNDPYEDLLIQGTISGRMDYMSTYGIIFHDAVIVPDAEVSAVSTTGTRLAPGTHIQSGARFHARIKADETP